MIKTKSLYTSRKNASQKTIPGNSRRKKTLRKFNPLENTKIKNTFYVIAVISLDFWRNKKFSTTNVNCKSGLTEKYFLATIFQSKIWVKTRSFDTSNFRRFSKNPEDILERGVWPVVHNMVHPRASNDKKLSNSQCNYFLNWSAESYSGVLRGNMGISILAQSKLSYSIPEIMHRLNKLTRYILTVD